MTALSHKPTDTQRTYRELRERVDRQYRRRQQLIQRIVQQQQERRRRARHRAGS